MRILIKKLAQLFLGNYSAYYIYQYNRNECSSTVDERDPADFRLLDNEMLKCIEDPLIKEESWYGGVGSLCFGCFLNQNLVGVCFYWYGDRYRTRNFWPLSNDEAKLVEIIVKPEVRGRGIATKLVRFSALEMAWRGYTGLYARIWHSNIPSIRAFERAGWRRIAFVAEINPFRSAHPIRIKKVF